MEYTEFVSSALGKICKSECDLSSQDLTHYAESLKSFLQTPLIFCVRSMVADLLVAASSSGR